MKFEDWRKKIEMPGDPYYLTGAERKK